QREQRIHQRLAPLGLLLAEMAIDVQRLRVQRHVGEQHVVHLRDRARERVLVEVADHEIVEIDAAALVAAQLGGWRRRLPPWGVRPSRAAGRYRGDLLELSDRLMTRLERKA